MSSQPSTKTEIAKFAVQALVAGTVAKQSKRVIVDNTEVDEDGVILDVGCSAIGLAAASKARPCTDALVDKVIDCYKSWKDRRNKETPE